MNVNRESIKKEFEEERDSGSQLLTVSAVSETDSIVTPLPAALPLFVSGLGALGFVGWRRKRKNANAAVPT